MIAFELCISLSALWPCQANAQHVVRPGTHPFWATFTLGPTIFIATERNDPAATWLHLNEQIGWHFLGHSSGPAIALDIHQVIGGFGPFANHFAFRIGPRFVYDIQVSPSLGVYISPSAGLGWAFHSLSGNLFGFGWSGTGNGLDLSAAIDVRVVLADRAVLFIRPFGMTFPVVWWTAGGTTNSRTVLSYEIFPLGGGVTF